MEVTRPIQRADVGVRGRDDQATRAELIDVLAIWPFSCGLGRATMLRVEY